MRFILFVLFLMMPARRAFAERSIWKAEGRDVVAEVFKLKDGRIRVRVKESLTGFSKSGAPFFACSLAGEDFGSGPEEFPTPLDLGCEKVIPQHSPPFKFKMRWTKDYIFTSERDLGGLPPVGLIATKVLVFDESLKLIGIFNRRFNVGGDSRHRNVTFHGGSYCGGVNMPESKDPEFPDLTVSIEAARDGCDGWDAKEIEKSLAALKMLVGKPRT